MFLLCTPVRPLLVNLTYPYPVLSSVSDIPFSPVLIWHHPGHHPLGTPLTNALRKELLSMSGLG